MNKLLFSVSVSILFLTSCSKGTVSAVQETNSEVKSEFNETKAALLYTNNCGSCHNLQPREKYTTSQWKKIVPPMAKKAKLSVDEEEQILQYVILGAKAE
ncbi:MAG: hypothetical protein RLZ10_1666 [Bacteroidota bacterium]|jgi:nitrate/TMAO reductase-like tetraheme cytochrome c subunit